MKKYMEAARDRNAKARRIVELEAELQNVSQPFLNISRNVTGLNNDIEGMIAGLKNDLQNEVNGLQHHMESAAQKVKETEKLNLRVREYEELLLQQQAIMEREQEAKRRLEEEAEAAAAAAEAAEAEAAEAEAAAQRAADEAAEAAALLEQSSFELEASSIGLANTDVAVADGETPSASQDELAVAAGEVVQGEAEPADTDAASGIAASPAVQGELPEEIQAPTQTMADTQTVSSVAIPTASPESLPQTSDVRSGDAEELGN